MVYIVCNCLIIISVILLIWAVIWTIALLSIIKRIAILVGTGFGGLEKNWKKEDSMTTK